MKLRVATPADARAVADLVAAFDAAFVEEPDRLSTDDVLEWWASAEHASVGVEGEEVVAVVVLRMRGGRCYGDAFVHPAAAGRGIGTRLVEWAEDHALSLGAPSLALDAIGGDERGRCLLRGRGYERIRSFFRMVIDFDEEPPPASWPAGFTVSSLAPGEERLLHETINAAFADHWRSTPRAFEEWIKGRTLEHDVCFLVRAGDEVAAEAACRTEFLGAGWVDTLGTRPEYRRRGVAEALLRHAFRELYLRGARRVGLGVDAENPTGATRLYERVGMRVAWASDVYEQTLDS